MLYSCTHVATVGVNGLMTVIRDSRDINNYTSLQRLAEFFSLHTH